MASINAVEPAVIARAFAYFFGLGALLVGTVPVLPGTQFDHPRIVAAAVAAALLTSIACLVIYDRIPRRVLQALPALGTVLISLVLAGAVPSSAPAFMLIYLWVVLSACYFFGLRVGLLHVAGIAVAAGATFIVREVPQGAMLWTVGIAAFAVTGLMLSLLRERADTLILQLDIAANTDALTGLPNRRSFDTRVDEELYRAGRTSQPVCLLALDVDHFKRINDGHGHAVGDRALRRVADALTAGRRIDLSARLGGDEFAVLLPATDRSGAAEVAERLRRTVADIATEPRCTVSVGIAAFPEDAACVEDLERAADCALYEAKERGRDCVVLFGPEMARRVRA